MRWFLTSLSPQPAPRPAPPSAELRREKTESIRAALIDALQGARSAGAFMLVQRIQNASDAERLWHLRPEAMSVLAGVHGEADAYRVLSRISPLFKDVLPDGLASRLKTMPAFVETR